ncbi:MAG: hypothetical protein ACJ71B_11520, partial [Nitrososphaera sp.]
SSKTLMLTSSYYDYKESIKVTDIVLGSTEPANHSKHGLSKSIWSFKIQPEMLIITCKSF